MSASPGSGLLRSGLRGIITAGIQNPVYANVLMICILVGGALAARTLVKETYPEFSLHRISIETRYPGASPEDVEQGVCIKIEEALEGLAGIKFAWSRADENVGLTIVVLQENVADPRELMLDIKDRIDQITTFPAEVERPVVSEMVVRTQVVNVAIYGDAAERTIRELAIEIRDELLGEETISQIELTGVRDPEISIQVSQEALLQYGLSLQEVAGIVARNSLDVPAGGLRTRNEELTIRMTGQRSTAREFEDVVVIARPDGTLIRLRQIASIRDGFEEGYKSGRFQGKPAAVLEIFKTSEQDTSTVARTVRRYVQRKRAQVPEQLHVAAWADSSRELDARISMLLENGVLGILLVVVVLTLFLDFRVSLYVALGVPISFGGALIVMHFTGQTLNMITLFGLIMVIGILVDDAIVIADSFRMRVVAGDGPALAAADGPADVALPVVASSVTTILAFLPLLFVAGIMGKIIAVLPVVVISAIVFSSIEVFGILPSHLQHCLRRQGEAGRSADARTTVRGRIEAWVDHLLVRFYRPLVRRGVRSRGVTVSVAVASLLLVIGLVSGGRVPFLLLPEIDGDTLRARVQFPQGIPVSRTVEATRQLELAAGRLNDDPALLHHGQGNLVIRKFSVAGQWSGWLQERGSHLGEVMIELMPTEKRKLDSEVILAAWEKQTGAIDDAVSVTFGRVQPGPAEKPIDIKLLGRDLGALETAAEDVADKLSRFSGVSGIEHDLRPGKREIRIKLRPLARTLGVASDDLARQLRNGFYGGEAVRVQRDGQDVGVQVRYPDAQRGSIGDVEKIRIRGPDGREIPFSELAEFEIRRGYATIYRQNGYRRARISADVDERHANAERILAAFENDHLSGLSSRHPGIRYRLEGQHEQILESLRSLFSAVLIALVGIYAVLAAMLRSYTQPIIIMAAIPLGFVGAIFGHFVTGYDLTILSIFGMAALSGVVVNDALVLLDRINVNLRTGRGIFDAIVEAGEHRFRAVMLTTITTIAGLGPLLLERSTQAQSLIPMAISLTFGLAVATLLTLVVVPALYLLLNDVRRLVRWLRAGGAYPSPEMIEQVRRVPPI